MTIRKILVEHEFPDCQICGKVIENREEYIKWEYEGRVWTSFMNSSGSSEDGITKEIVMCKRCGDIFLEQIDERLDELVLDVKEKVSEA